MTIRHFLTSCEPTNFLQAVVATYADVTKSSNSRGACRQTLFQGSLLTIAVITGIGTCASEGLTLVADLFCKGGKKTVGAAQQLTQSEHLDKLYQFLPSRPPLSFRIERIISQGLGIIVSVLGTLCVFALRQNWVIQQHQNLGNYNPKATPRSRSAEPSPTAGKEPASPARAQHPVNPALAALARAIHKPPAASTSPSPVAQPDAALPSRPPRHAPPPVPAAVSPSGPPPPPPAPPPLPPAAEAQPLPEIDASRVDLLAAIRARGQVH